MTGIAIYVEGGGETAQGKAMLRQGISEFLHIVRDACRHKLRWKVVACGSRNDACEAFLHATRTTPEFLSLLLVDSEAPVADPSKPADHLARRDGWRLAAIAAGCIHLMIQTMETWILSDTRALEAFYGQGFLVSALPRAQNLEGIAKADIAAALERATAGTRSKGGYHKIRHGCALLARIDSGLVRTRCPSCDRLFTALLGAVERA